MLGGLRRHPFFELVSQDAQQDMPGVLRQGDAARGHPAAGGWGGTHILTNIGDLRDRRDREHPRVVAGSSSGGQDGRQNPRLQVSVPSWTKSNHEAGHPFILRTESNHRPYRPPCRRDCDPTKYVDPADLRAEPIEDELDLEYTKG